MKKIAIVLLAIGSFAMNSYAAGNEILMKCKASKEASLLVQKDNQNKITLQITEDGDKSVSELKKGSTFKEFIGSVDPKDDFSLKVLKEKRISPRSAVLVRSAQIDSEGTQLITYHNNKGKQLVGVIVFPSVDPEPSFCL